MILYIYYWKIAGRSAIFNFWSLTTESSSPTAETPEWGVLSQLQQKNPEFTEILYAKSPYWRGGIGVQNVEDYESSKLGK